MNFRKQDLSARIVRKLSHVIKRLFSFLGVFKGIASPWLLRDHDKLHLGSGPNRMAGWANVDVSGAGNIIWDLRKPLPLKNHSIRLIYSEHFIEHISRDEALRLLRNCRALLADAGVLRISTPDLRRLAQDYLAGNIPVMPHVAWRPATPCAMINEGMRLWGHQFIYDEEELTSLLNAAGFSVVRRVRWRQSEHPELRNLETRPDFGDLILEAH